MEPTKAPWALGATGGRGGGFVGRDPSLMPSASATGERRPVPQLIKAPSRMPDAIDVGEGHVWQPASRKIKSQDDLSAFLKSKEIHEYVGFLLSLNDAVKGLPLSSSCHISPASEAMVALLEQIDSWVTETPAVPHTSRYGNPAYRDLHKRIVENAVVLLEHALPDDLKGAAVELSSYLAESFGNATRIDYGTGHETNFVVLLFCLAKLGVFSQQDRKALVLVIFRRYLDLVRRIQTTYWLEPAGSQGVWGLDDYQFLPFFWGAAQLMDHPIVTPGGIHNERHLEEFGGEYMYLGCVLFVKSVKKGHLAETSPMLNDISAVISWSKINTGMMKMYQAEVLAKLPVMQHFLFGSIFKWDSPTE